MRKELRPVHDNVACDVCGRTILKGERTEAYLAPGGQRRVVCDLCGSRAAQAGWIRESAAGDAPSRGPRPQERRPLRERLKRKREGDLEREQPLADHELPAAEPGPEPYEAAPWDEEPAHPEPVAPTRRERPPRPKDPRHIRAVPTTAEVKVTRALEMFNDSEHQRTVAGITRTLGIPWVSASPELEAPSEVTIVVAWELSWYRYRVDLGDETEPVVLLEKGDEVDEIDAGLRDWNASADDDGQLLTNVGSAR